MPSLYLNFQFSVFKGTVDSPLKVNTVLLILTVLYTYQMSPRGGGKICSVQVPFLLQGFLSRLSLLTQHGSCHFSIIERGTIFNFLSHVGLEFIIPIIYSNF